MLSFLNERDLFLSKKNLNPNMFTDPILLSADISEHAAWLFRHIYSKSYSQSTVPHEDIARFHHGITHVSRAAIYIPIFANLYRKYDDIEACLLTNDDIKLLQIAALLHDAAREGDEEDKWDDESGTLLYYYLIFLGVDANKACFLAEAIANKDLHAEGYHQLIIQDNKPIWSIAQKRPKNIYQELIHDADCLDIIRARDHFDATYLDFFEKIAAFELGDSFEEMAQLITEARSLIAKNGDHRQKTNRKLKKIYESENGFQHILSQLKNKNFYIMQALYQNGALLSPESLKKSFLPKLTYDPQIGLKTMENVKAAMREFKLFARGIGMPSAMNKKPLASFNSTPSSYYFTQYFIDKEDLPASEESLANFELRKIMRKPGIPTTSSKPDRELKNGNKNRSLCIVGPSGFFASAGFLILDLDVDDITSISIIDSDTGWQKKKGYIGNLHTREEKEECLKNLIRKIKMGGSSRRFSSYPIFPSTHTEITGNLKKIDAIYYSKDPNFRNIIDNRNPAPVHRFSPFLQAIFIQGEHEKQYGIKLPIFKCSGIHFTIRHIKENEYNDAELLNKWQSMCHDYMKKQLNDLDKLVKFANQSLSDIKIQAMYGTKSVQQTALISKIKAGDINYPLYLQNEIERIIKIDKINLLQSKSLMTQILFDIASGNLESLMEKANVAITSSDWNNNFEILAMRAAINGNQIKILQYLLSVPKKIKYLSAKSDLSGKTPLHFAVENKNIPIIEILLNEKIDVNAPDHNNTTPLDFAITSSCTQVIKLLIDAGAIYCPSKIIKKSSEPLIISAIKNGEDKLVKELLEINPHIDFTYSENVSFILKEKKSLIYKEDKKIIKKILLEAYCPDFTNEKDSHLLTDNSVLKANLTPLQLAILLRQKRITALLLLYSPSIMEEFIYAKRINFIWDLTAEDQIETIVENKNLLSQIHHVSPSCAENLINQYFQKHDKIIEINNAVINFIQLSNSTPFFNKIINGQLIGWRKDEHGRYLTKSTFWTSRDGLCKFFINKNFTLFNFHGWSIQNFDLTGSSWSFQKSDCITFIDCKMDNLYISPGSNLIGISIYRPQFVNLDDAEYLANFYEYIPGFILQKNFECIIDKLIIKNKKINLSWSFAFDKIIDIIEENEFSLFQKIWTAIDTNLHEKEILEIIKTLVTKKYGFAYLNILFKTINLSKLGTSIIDSLNYPIFKKTPRHYKMINFLLENVLNNQISISILSLNNPFVVLHELFLEKYSQIKINPVIFCAHTPRISKMHFSDNLKWLYIMIRNWIYLFASLPAHLMTHEKVYQLHGLLLQLQSVYFDYGCGHEIHGLLTEIKKQQALFISTLNNELLSTQYTYHTNLISYLEIYMGNSFKGNIDYLDLTDKSLSHQHIHDLFIFLKHHPLIKDLGVDAHVLNPNFLNLLSTIHAFRYLTIFKGRIDDHCALLLSQFNTIKKLFFCEDAHISLYGMKAILSNLNFKKIGIDKSCKTALTEEKKALKTICQEKNAFTRIAFGYEIGLIPKLMPSLQNLSLFAAKREANKNKNYRKKFNQLKLSLVKH